MAIYICEREVVELITMADAIRAVEDMFRRWSQGFVVNHPRRRIRIPSGYLMIMEGADTERGSGFKAYIAAGAHTNMLVNLYSSESGELLAIIESNHLGAIRTGATTGVATGHMASPESSTAAIIGSGRQAETQLAALCEVRPLKHVKVFSRTSERREAFSQKMSEMLHVPIEPVDSARECVEGASIVVAATPSRDPVIDGAWLAPGSLVIAVGSNMWQRREIDEATIGRSEIVVVDDLETARRESGELIWGVERGIFRWEQARELRDVVAGIVSGTAGPTEIALFESQGLAVEDLAVAWTVWRLAKERGMGTTMPMSY